jgi:hypothetical protein
MQQTFFGSLAFLFINRETLNECRLNLIGIAIEGEENPTMALDIDLES